MRVYTSDVNFEKETMHIIFHSHCIFDTELANKMYAGMDYHCLRHLYGRRIANRFYHILSYYHKSIYQSPLFLSHKKNRSKKIFGEKVWLIIFADAAVNTPRMKINIAT